MIYRGCECEECRKLPLGLGHTSDCAVHIEPAEPKGECNCGALEILEIKEKWNKDWPSQHLVYPVYIDKLLNWIFGESIPSENKKDCDEEEEKLKDDNWEMPFSGSIERKI